MKGFALGLSFAAVGIVGFAYGQGQRQPSAQELVAAGRCRVDVGFPTLQGGNQCFGNRVMVGAQDQLLYCADLTVTCDSRDAD
jgi:hypothetical protein